MEPIGSGPARLIVVKEMIQVIHIVAVVDEYDPIHPFIDPPHENELILASNRRTIPIPYNEEP